MLFGKKPLLKLGQAVTSDFTMPSVSNFTPPCSTPRSARVKFHLNSPRSEENYVEFHLESPTRRQNHHNPCYVSDCVCVCASPHEHGAWNSQRSKLRHTSEIDQHANRAQQMAEERRRQKWGSVLNLGKTLDNTRHALHVLKRFLDPRRLLACIRGKTNVMRRRTTVMQWERLQEFRRSRSLDCLSVQELIDLKILLEDRLRSFEESNTHSNSSFTSTLPSAALSEKLN